MTAHVSVSRSALVALVLALSLPACTRTEMVPDTVGKTEADARRSLEAAGLEVTVVKERRGGTPGAVVEQSPRGGQPLPGDATVRLVVEDAAQGQSPGAGQVEVPDLTGRTAEQAEQALLAVGLKRGTTTSRSGPEPAGTVVDQTPRIADRVPFGTEVSLTIAAAAGARMPSIVGQTESAALQALSDARLRVRMVELRLDGAEPAGTIVGQSPAAGTETTPGQEVDITVRENIPRDENATRVSGSTREFQCAAGQSVLTRGTRNNLHVKGPCRMVTVAGTENVVRIDSADAIYVMGTLNRVTWGRGVEGPPRAGKTGDRNTLERAQ